MRKPSQCCRICERLSCFSSISLWLRYISAPWHASTYCPCPKRATRYILSNAEVRLILNVPLGMRYLSRFCAALLVYPVEVITNRVLFAPVFFSTAEITLLSALSILTYVSCSYIGLSGPERFLLFPA